MPTRLAQSSVAPSETSTEAPKQYLITALTADPAKALKYLEKMIDEHSGAIKKSEDLGPRTLAYPIDRQRELNLVSVFFSISPAAIKPLNDKLAAQDSIARYLLTIWRADIDQTKPKAAKKATRANV